MIYDELIQPLTTGYSTQNKSIRILTLNLFLRPPLVKNNESDYKDERVQFFCREILDNYDIVCLQEVFSTLNSRRSQIISLASKKGLIYTCNCPSPGFFSAQVIDGGLLILSRYPILESDFLGFGNGLFPDIFSYKGVLHAKVQVPGKDIHFFTLHTQATYPSNDEEKLSLYREARKEQLELTVRFIEKKIMENQDPFLILGDFNINGKSEEYFSLLEVLKKLDVTDLIRLKHGESLSTYGVILENGEPEETVLSHRNECRNNTSIDYIFLSNRGGVEADLQNTFVCPFYVQGQRFTRISDHYGVQTFLNIHS
jgi:sphingomyelin phosphodiesterase